MAHRQRFTTKDILALALLNDAASNGGKGWREGDTTYTYKHPNGETAKIVRFEGDNVHLDNGESMHRSHLRRPSASTK